MGYSPPWPPGHRLRHISVVQKTPLNFRCGNIVDTRTLQGGESVISWWKRRLPLLSVFTGLKKGRTLRFLGQAVVKLGSHEDTLEDFNLLKLHERRYRLAQELRPRRFRGLTWVDLLAALATLVEESVQVPVKLMKQIVEKRIAPPHAHRRRVSVCRSLDRHVPLSGGRIGADTVSRRGLRLLGCSHGRPLPAPPVQQGLRPCHHGGRV